jgi:hypothetical protein
VRSARFNSALRQRAPALSLSFIAAREHGDTKDAAALMRPAGEDVLQRWPVSKRVNSSRAPDDDATLIDAIEMA